MDRKQNIQQRGVKWASTRERGNFRFKVTKDGIHENVSLLKYLTLVDQQSLKTQYQEQRTEYWDSPGNFVGEAKAEITRVESTKGRLIDNQGSIT